MNGINAEWTLANNKNNELSRRVFGDNIGRLTQAQYRRYFSTNDNAREAFLRRKEQGLNLSERVWKYADDFKNDIELGLDVGIRNGLDAPKMARQLQQFLQHPDMLFRRVRNEHGNLVLSQRAADFHPGRGVYRSSYMNARRLAVTETNIAYRTADYERYKQLDFVVGIEVRLSNNHNCKGVPKGTYYDICDELQGKYPKDFKFTGWHPHCRCHVVSILKTEAELSQGSQAILNGEEPSEESVNRVDEVPEAFKKWVENNSDRIAKAKNQPYFLKDNGTYKNGAWTIKEFAQSKPKTAPKIKTPSIQQTALPALNESQLELYKAAMAAEKDERDTIIIDLMNELQINGMTYPEAVEFVKANFRKSDKWLVGNTYFGDNMVIGKRGAFRSDVTPNGLFAEPYEPSKWIYERVKAKGGTLTIEDTQQLVRDAASRYEITYSEAERMIRGLGYGNKYFNIQFYTNAGLYNIYAEKRQIEKVFTPATPAKPTLLELAEKRHAARTPEEVQKIKDKWVKRKEQNPTEPKFNPFEGWEAFGKAERAAASGDDISEWVDYLWDKKDATSDIFRHPYIKKDWDTLVDDFLSTKMTKAQMDAPGEADPIEMYILNHGKKTTLPVHKLRPTQPWVGEPMDGIMRRHLDMKGRVAVIHIEGTERYYIANGHHRAINQILWGKETVDACVIEAPNSILSKLSKPDKIDLMTAKHGIKSSKFGRYASRQEKAALAAHTELHNYGDEQMKNFQEINKATQYKKGKPKTFDEADHGLSNIKKDKKNCAACVLTHELRLRGYDITALPYGNDVSVALSANTRLIWLTKKNKMPEFTALIGGSEQEIIAKIEKATQTIGSRYHLGWDTKVGEGHIITAVRTKERLVLYDPQTDEYWSLYDIIKMMKPDSKLELLRVDRLLVRPDLLKFLTETVV